MVARALEFIHGKMLFKYPNLGLSNKNNFGKDCGSSDSEGW